MLRRLLTHILIVVTLATPVLMHGGSWLLSSPASAANAGAAPTQDQTSHCPQHQSRDSNCCPQCVGWLTAKPSDAKKAIVFRPAPWPQIEALLPARLLAGEEKRDDGGGYVSAQSGFGAFFARTSRLII